MSNPEVSIGVYSEVYFGVSLRACLGVCSQAGELCTIDSNWEGIVKQARSVALTAIRNIQSSRLGVYH